MQIVKGIELLGGLEQEPNLYLIDGEMLVDCGTGFIFPETKKAIEGKCETYKLRRIVNTHGHFDNIGAAKKFRDWLKAEICAHVGDRDMFESGAGNLAELFGGGHRVVTVDRFLRDGYVLKTTNFAFTVLHTPGHTPGSISLYDQNSKILITGDTLFESAIGRSDLPGGNRDKLLASLEKMKDLNVNYLLPGHGPPKHGGFSFHVKQMIAHFGEKRFINYSHY